MKRRFQHREERWIRRLIAAFVLATCLRVWTDGAPAESVARAQLPDSAGQRLALIRETQRTNDLLKEIKQILSDHTLHVRIEGADNQAHAPVGGRLRKP